IFDPRLLEVLNHLSTDALILFFLARSSFRLYFLYFQYPRDPNFATMAKVVAYLWIEIEMEQAMEQAQPSAHHLIMPTSCGKLL
ncbi:MAG: hypothetical protein MJA30_22620, partial [Cytophagales bacterium]|nr:hypothetical protein [Cytophagales bacterium]